MTLNTKPDMMTLVNLQTAALNDYRTATNRATINKSIEDAVALGFQLDADYPGWREQIPAANRAALTMPDYLLAESFLLSLETSVIGRMRAENARDFSDGEIIRCLSGCCAGLKLMRIAKRMQERGIAASAVNTDEERNANSH